MKMETCPLNGDQPTKSKGNFFCPNCKQKAQEVCLLVVSGKIKFILRYSSKPITCYKMEDFNNLLQIQPKTQPITPEQPIKERESYLEYLTFCCENCLKLNKQLSHSKILFSTEVDFCCIQHRKALDFYCKECRITLCADCKKDSFHSKHLLMEINPQTKSAFEDKLNVIDEIFLKNKLKKNQLIEMLNESNEFPVNTLMQWKRKIEFLYERYNSINHQMKEIIKSFFAIALIFQAYMYTSFIKFYQNIKINYTDLDLDRFDLEKSYTTLKKSLKYQCISIDQKEKQNYKELKGHDNLIWSIIKLNDGQLASASADNTIKLWNIKTFQCMATLNGHNWDVSSIIQLNDGRLASGSYDKTIKFWDLEKFNCEVTLTGHNSMVLCLVQLNDGRLASGSYDKTIKLWNISTFSCINTLIGHGNYVWSLIQLNDGQLASGSGDKTIKIWNTTTFHCNSTLYGHSDCVGSLTQLKTGELVSGSFDKTIKIWNINNNQCISSLTGHTSNVSCLAVLVNGEIISGSDDKTLKLWNVRQFSCIRVFSESKSMVTSVVQLNDGQVAYCLSNNIIKIISID